MGLKLVGVSRVFNDKKVYRKFESMGKNLLLIKLEILPQKCIPFHWLLENGKKPPFDIAINPYDGSISYMKFFFQDEKIEKFDVFINQQKKQEGTPQFDISNFNEKNYQIFEKGNVEANLNGKNLYLIISNAGANQVLNLDDNNAMLFDANAFCTGVLFKNLLEEIGELIRSQILIEK
ncbi:hypothetical protein SAMN05660742_1099 [Propionispira arboris]|uniref:Uncharacterized protein n=1 Tax=Propionispira arboris TaxID=84035 RepID=A0A1H6ZF30_9FIRM|nr:hypothetical protein [Propionispira arboris]SEJ50077.1 hypothetical protein SAMN05660742_1099 [Propionispira arboris]